MDGTNHFPPPGCRDERALRADRFAIWFAMIVGLLGVLVAIEMGFALHAVVAVDGGPRAADPMLSPM